MQLPGVQGLLERGAHPPLAGPHRAVVGHGRIAEAAGDRFIGAGVVDEVRVAAPVEQENRLLALGNGVFKEFLKSRREQMNALAQLRRLLEVNDLDRRHRPVVHALGQDMQLMPGARGR